MFRQNVDIKQVRSTGGHYSNRVLSKSLFGTHIINWNSRSWYNFRRKKWESQHESWMLIERKGIATETAAQAKHFGLNVEFSNSTIGQFFQIVKTNDNVNLNLQTTFFCLDRTIKW